MQHTFAVVNLKIQTLTASFSCKYNRAIKGQPLHTINTKRKGGGTPNPPPMS